MRVPEGQHLMSRQSQGDEAESNPRRPSDGDNCVADGLRSARMGIITDHSLKQHLHLGGTGRREPHRIRLGPLTNAQTLGL